MVALADVPQTVLVCATIDGQHIGEYWRTGLTTDPLLGGQMEYSEEADTPVQCKPVIPRPTEIIKAPQPTADGLQRQEK